MLDSYIPTPENPGRILVVDDLPGNLKVLSMELKHQPFVLTLAQSAEEAIEHCKEQPFEGILMDVSLTGMDGIEACRQIRELPLNERTPLDLPQRCAGGPGLDQRGHRGRRHRLPDQALRLLRNSWPSCG